MLPQEVTLVAKGSSTTAHIPLKKSGDNVYAGTLKDIKLEETKYYATAEDYETDTRKVSVLSPPTLTALLCDQYHPAYLYYRPLTDDGSDVPRPEAGHDDARPVVQRRQRHQDQPRAGRL